MSKVEEIEEKQVTITLTQGEKEIQVSAKFPDDFDPNVEQFSPVEAVGVSVLEFLHTSFVKDFGGEDERQES